MQAIYQELWLWEKLFLKFISPEQGSMDHNSTQFPANILSQQTACQVSANPPNGHNSVD